MSTVAVAVVVVCAEIPCVGAVALAAIVVDEAVKLALSCAALINLVSPDA